MSFYGDTLKCQDVFTQFRNFFVDAVQRTRVVRLQRREGAVLTPAQNKESRASWSTSAETPPIDAWWQLRRWFATVCGSADV